MTLSPPWRSPGTKRLVSRTIFVASLVLAVPGIAFRLVHPGSLPLAPFDVVAIAVGFGLFIASLVDFWNARIRRGAIVGVVRLALTGLVAVHLDVPLVVSGALHAYATQQITLATTDDQRLRAALVELAIVDRETFASLATIKPERIADERGGRSCRERKFAFDARVERAIPKLATYLTHRVVLCQSAQAAPGPPRRSISPM